MNILTEVRKRWFLIGIVIVILMAKVAPQLGAKGGRKGVEWFMNRGALFGSKRILCGVNICTM